MGERHRISVREVNDKAKQDGTGTIALPVREPPHKKGDRGRLHLVGDGVIYGGMT